MKEEKIPEPIELFGYECGKGWYPLIEEAQKIVDEWNELHKDGLDTWGGYKLEFVQVKEKWGELCIYLNFYPDKLYDKLLELSERSRHICEECGETEGATLENTHGWYMTLCPECRAKEIERYRKLVNK
jgi:hypothetical protein